MAKAFMDRDFLLGNETARTLFHKVAAKMPIIDYHCHIDPQQIYEDKVFTDLSEAWLGGDHYKWRALRANGVPECFITGDAAPYEKFEQWAGTLPRLIGNPLYHWTHLELQRYFGIDEPLNGSSCGAIWEKANEKLKTLSVRQIIRQSDVRVICTTDDPADDLKWHKLIKEDPAITFQVLPAFRPDKALNIDKPGFLDYLDKLSKASGLEIRDYGSLADALARRITYFAAHGCRAADHGLDYVMFSDAHSAETVLQKALEGKPLTREETDSYKTTLLCRLAGLYRRHGIVMQLHYGAVRNVNPTAFKTLGPDTGYDAIWGRADSGKNLAGLLARMEEGGGLPRTIVYSLNPTDNAQISTVLGGFQSDEAPGRMQHGSAWWFNDTKLGMTAQMTALADTSVLGTFIGMLTDSRSFLSYTRHEYFRRILCGLLGSWVEEGEYPADMAVLRQLVEDICWNNAIRYFNLA